MLIKDRYYETDVSSMICCGECWQKAVEKTAAGDSVGDEAVYEIQLTLLPNDEPYQCDECLKQSENYDDFV